MKSSTFERLDLARLRWVNQMKSVEMPVSGNILAAKAPPLAKKM